MAHAVVPTKGNLIQTKKTLTLAKTGFDLMDRKRNILLREILRLIDRAKTIRVEIDDCYRSAYLALQNANIIHGLCREIADAVPIEEGLSLTARSVMGVEVPIVRLEKRPLDPVYGLADTSCTVDEAYFQFDRVKQLTAELAEVETGVYRLAAAVGKTQKRANALRNIIIPRLTTTSKQITDSLEEKEREEFSRLKQIKARQSD